MRLPLRVAAGSGAALAATYTIAGKITSGVANLADVLVTLGAYSATTAADGTYTITGIPASTSGDLTPTKTGYTFYPATIAISAMSGNLTAQNFSDIRVVADGFSGTNGDNVSGRTPDTVSNGNTWSVPAGAFNIQSNKASSVGTTAGFLLINSGISDGVISGVLAPIDFKTTALIVRYTDPDNRWAISINPQNQHFSIFEITTAIATERAFAVVTAIDNTTPQNIIITLDGTSIKATINGGHEISYTSSSHQTATIHGMRSGQIAGQTLDNFEVKNLV